MSATPEPVGAYLVRTGILSEARVQHLLNVAGDGERLLSCALAQGAAPERPLARALAVQSQNPVLVFSASSIDLSALQVVPLVVARSHRVLPVAIDKETITLAVSDLGPRPIFDQIAFATGRSVVPLLALETALMEALEAAYAAAADRMAYLSGEHAPHNAGPGDAKLSTEVAARLDPEMISHEIETAVDVSADDLVIASAPANVRPEPCDILLIEDDEAVSDLVRRVLKHDALRVEIVANGRAALERLRTSRPRLIILDAMLPEVHGFEICRAVKSSATFAQTPVVMISAVYKGWQHAHEIQEVHGADVFIEKPFDVHYLRKVVAEHIGETVVKAEKTDQVREEIAALLARADENYRAGNAAAAESLAQQVRALDPFHPIPWLLIGNIRTKAEKLDAAMHAYERATTFAPRMFSANKNLALVYERLGFRRKAERAWRNALASAPDDGVKAAIASRLAAFAAPSDEGR